MLRQQVQWSQLPNNLWATIFLFIVPESGMGLFNLKHGQSWYWELRTVCQTFKKVFEDHGDLNSLITVRRNTPGCHLLSLVAWLRQHQAHVKRLSVGQSSPWLESTLIALQSPHTCLQSVYFDVVVPEAMSLLSAFRSITECTLCSSTQDLSLQALSVLPQLTNLKLEHGTFSCLETVAHLTALSLESATAVCAQDCSCVTSLVCLNLVFAKLVRFHSGNVAACPCLQSLVVKDAFIGAIDVEKGFGFLNDHNDEITIPYGLSALTAVTSLALAFPTRLMELEWVTTLSALQSFQLVARQAVFPHSWSAMTNLQSLAIDGRFWGNRQELLPWSVSFQFDEHALTSLRTLELQHVVIKGENLSGLASLPSLQKVYFNGLRSLDVSSCTQIARFAFNLGRYRQDVEFCIE